MDWLFYFKAALLGIIEGLTEFLPVSSTGHLIVFEDLIGFAAPNRETFIIAIQAGAILAVCWDFRARLFAVLRGLASEPVQQRLVSSAGCDPHRYRPWSRAARAAASRFAGGV